MNERRLEHRAADLSALHDVVPAGGRLDEIVDERVDAAGAGLPEQSQLLHRQVGGSENARTKGIVDVVVDVGDPVDDTDDLALERGRLARARVVEDAVREPPT